MEQMQMFMEKLTDWLERLLLKGIYKIDGRDINELLHFQETALAYEMSFLAGLLEELASEGRSYTRSIQTDAEPLVTRFLYVAQYLSMLKRTA
ncbi:hypothetical protein [uncultured Brevibacillus sp.]|uniref:hypothetical protein n=1 Tax=uncultured Brevibacillus sp. TaxID=169970 RepID=UPI002597BFF9|nr:hypothetical protein [uncultured Brevibacillus sp.]